MDRGKLAELLEGVRAGDVSVVQAIDRLRENFLEELDFATVDLQRAMRRGFPEAVYAPGKTESQISEIAGRLRQAGQTVLITRAGRELHECLVRTYPDAVFHESSRAIVIRQGDPEPGRPGVLVLSAGTADEPVAAEAALTSELMGNAVRRVNDVGVAGLHRLLAHRKEILEARVIVVVAGMDGVLPTVVAGLTDRPVIGVPTSVGYGTGERGRAALLGMLNSCVAGLIVVNIDNGFGAGYAAGLINRLGPAGDEKLE